MKMIKVYYDNSSGRGYKYLNTSQIVTLKRGWKDYTFVKDTLGRDFYINESIEEVLKNIEGVEA